MIESPSKQTFVYSDLILIPFGNNPNPEEHVYCDAFVSHKLQQEEFPIRIEGMFQVDPDRQIIKLIAHKDGQSRLILPQPFNILFSHAGVFLAFEKKLVEVQALGDPTQFHFEELFDSLYLLSRRGIILYCLI